MKPTRQFLRDVLASGLEENILGPDDLLRHVSPEMLAVQLPTDLKAKLLAASLKAAAMNPALVVDTLGVEVLAEHMPTHALWSCVAEMASAALGDKTGKPTAPAPEPEPPGETKGVPPSSTVAPVPPVVSAAPSGPVSRAPTRPPTPSPAGPPAPPPGTSATPPGASAAPPVPGKKAQASAPAPRSGQRRPARLTPRRAADDFDIDTDVGEDWPNAKNREAEALGAAPIDDGLGDWQQAEDASKIDVGSKS